MLSGVTQNKAEAKIYCWRGQEKMLAPAEQVKLGVGGFKLEDSNYKPQWNPPSNPAQVPYQARDDQVIDCFKAAEKYGGILVVDHRARDQPIDCYKAAKKFGGILVVDYPVRDQTTAAEKYGSQLMKYPATKAPPHMPLTQGYYF
ncbi:uncharacterized protein LOC131315054 [Rhododendron vialii]|uniref:uncharacterized protein LOC131315054 n=1 Tax=Rhododendron vialii TaxID=182163 RepID=UPI00265EEA37|nr:uncharacterized protein LOC131315054 [Rhododendron vialii]